MPPEDIVLAAAALVAVVPAWASSPPLDLPERLLPWLLIVHSAHIRVAALVTPAGAVATLATTWVVDGPRRRRHSSHRSSSNSSNRGEGGLFSVQGTQVTSTVLAATTVLGLAPATTNPSRHIRRLRSASAATTTATITIRTTGAHGPDGARTATCNTPPLRRRLRHITLHRGRSTPLSQTAVRRLEERHSKAAWKI